MKYPLVVITVLLLGGSVQAQRWGSGGCPPTAQFVPMMLSQIQEPIKAKEGWYETFPGEVALYRGGAQIGGWNIEGQYYLPLVAGEWGTRCDPPSPVPAIYLHATEPEPEPQKIKQIEQVDQVDPLNFGLDRSKIGGKEEYSINGKPCSKERAYQLIQDKSLVDDSKKLRLTVIGTKAECEPVLADLKGNPDLSNLTKEMLIRDYRPDHWHVDGLFANGSPSIYYQQPDGIVLARFSTYPGATLFATALRKADPSYDPNKDPDPNKTPGPNPPGPNNPGPNTDPLKINLPAWILAIPPAVLLTYFVMRRKTDGI